MEITALATLPEPGTLPGDSFLRGDNSLKSWLLTQDHKRIALLYLITTIFFFVFGLLAWGVYSRRRARMLARKSDVA